MNTQAIQKKLDEYMETATPEQIVKEFEDLGVEFINTNDMNLIQQLQECPKWKEFEEWYNTFYGVHKEVDINLYSSTNYLGFINLPLSFQKGVFEKFIESQEGVFEQTSNADYSNRTYSIWTVETGYKKSKSFEELLIWYFNN